MEILRNFNLASHSTWKVGGPADYCALPKNIEEVREALNFAEEKKLPVTVLGGGSNVLISDKGIRGLVLITKNLNQVESEEAENRLRITAWAGAPKAEVLKKFLKAKLAPALFLAGLPGDVAGGVVMNAGVGDAVTPREFVEIVDWVEVLPLTGNGLSKCYLKSQLQWSYRHSSGWQPGVILRVGLSWPLEPDPDILLKVRTANENRQKRQPLELPSCGSVFVNPPGDKAGRLIEHCGLKGYKVGGAQVSEKHANFIVNIAQAKASDIKNVIEHVQSVVAKQTGIQLKTEVIFLGE